MKISELIAELEDFKQEYGDLNVVTSNTGTGEVKDMGLVEKFANDKRLIFWVA